jgi:hypothetical protein
VSLQAGQVALHNACISGNFSVAKYLIEKCDADIDITDEVFGLIHCHIRYTVSVEFMYIFGWI